MPRAKGGYKTRKYHKKVLDQAKGYHSGRRRLYKVAAQSVEKALLASYRDRRLKKREFRSLWITRISAAVRSLGMTYSEFISGLKAANITLNRKALADLAYYDPKAFSDIVTEVKAARA